MDGINFGRVECLLQNEMMNTEGCCVDKSVEWETFRRDLRATFSIGLLTRVVETDFPSSFFLYSALT